MATVTGYTAARMKQIEDAAIIDGEVVGNDLILEPKGFATNPGTYPKINAGNVRGPVGPTGPVGEVTEAELAAGLAATRVPAGAVTMWAGAAAPATWALCDGGESNRTTEAALFAAIGTTYGVGNGTTTFNRPDLRSRFPVGKGAATWSDALNESGGSANAVLPQHQHTTPLHSHTTPAHQHSTASHGHDVTHGHGASSNAVGGHSHGGITAVDGSHNHPAGDDSSWQYMVRHQGAGGNALQVLAGSDLLEWHWDVGSAGETHWHAISSDGGHDHVINVSATGVWAAGSGTLVTAAGEGSGNTGNSNPTTDNTGVSPTNANLPPYLTLNFIIKL